ncbi:MAG: GxxExxY protein [Patescibacteria group bacterium]|nr:GxxExxY protein [Patescibacteria group bacterium]
MRKEVEIIYKDLSYNIVGIMFEVFNELGYGYQEKHYEKAVEKIFVERKINYKRQLPYNIIFHEEKIGTYYLDFLVEDKIIVELKRGNYFSRKNINQVKEYLKVTGHKLALIINFTAYGVKTLRILNPNNKESVNYS